MTRWIGGRDFTCRLRRSAWLSASILLSIVLAFSPAAQVQGATPGAPEQQARAVSGIDDLQRLFQDPPDDSRIMMRWWWFGPAVTRTQLERELRLMREAGIGGVEIQPVYPVALDDPGLGIRTLPFLSEEFLDALRFAAGKGRELGLRVDLTLGSGWPYGGPGVTIDQAAGRLRHERVAVPEGSRRVPVPPIAEGERLIATFLARPREPGIDPQSVREISLAPAEEGRSGTATDLEAHGLVRLPADLEGPHVVLFFIASRTGMQVKRPAIGGEGFVLNHYDRTALDAYLTNVGRPLVDAFGDHPPYAVFCDSLEVYDADWTGDFLTEFRRRRGYDLTPHLPALFVEIGRQTPALRHDWGQTLTELFDARFLAPLQEWSTRNGTRFRVQAYGIPPATIGSHASVDLPEGEGWHWKILRASRWASSASHIYGKPVTSSETWTWLHSPSFRATPLDVKAEADLHFLQGINQLIGHGWPYTAEGAAYPGWRFYAAAAFNEKNPWWIVMPDLSRYLQRVSFMLRQGEPANDVALYLPNSDAWAHFVPGKVRYMIDALGRRIGPNVVARTLESGFNLDFFDDGALAQVGRVEGDALVLGPNRYRAVILPNVQRMPIETLRTLEAFARGGGVLIATRRLPELAPGFLATDADHRQVRDTARRLFEDGPGHFVDDESAQLAGTLAGAIRPDLQLSPSVPEIGFVHRRSGFADIYFLANTSNVRRQVTATFRVKRRHAESWDPFDGRVSPVEAAPADGGGMTLAIDLEPYGSRVLVFVDRAPSRASARPADVGPGSGMSRQIDAEALPPIDISSDWRVSFGAGSAPVAMDRLRSWTEDEETRYFSGVATYEKDVEVPANMLRAGSAVRLDFGDGQPVSSFVFGAGPAFRAWLDAPVREAAVVYVNDQRAGSVWRPPYSVDVRSLLKPGTNRIRVEVANLAVNHMAGHSLPDYRLLNLRYGVRFENQDQDRIEPVPSGLLGPIRLIPAR